MFISFMFSKSTEDAAELLETLINTCDNGLEALGQASIFGESLGISLVDQKILKDCPHR